MKILLTGANGLLGTAIRVASLKRGHTCIPLDRDQQDWLKYYAYSITRLDADVVIHAAADTNVERCEADPDSCYRDNYLLSQHAAMLAASTNKKFVFISSTGVYGFGKTAPYAEYDDVTPTTHYHKSKFMAENAIQSISHDSLIIRTGWLFGMGGDGSKNFVAKRIEEAMNASSGSISANKDQFGNPSYNMDVAIRIIELIELDFSGIFNCVNSGATNRFEYVKKILEFANIPVSVREADSHAFNRIAHVSNNESATDWRSRAMGLASLPDWRHSLQQYILSLNAAA